MESICQSLLPAFSVCLTHISLTNKIIPPNIPKQCDLFFPLLLSLTSLPSFNHPIYDIHPSTCLSFSFSNPLFGHYLLIKILRGEREGEKYHLTPSGRFTEQAVSPKKKKETREGENIQNIYIMELDSAVKSTHKQLKSQLTVNYYGKTNSFGHTTQNLEQLWHLRVANFSILSFPPQ